MKFGHLLGLSAVDAFSDMEKTSIGIPKIGSDVTMKCEGLHLSVQFHRILKTIKSEQKLLIAQLRAALQDRSSINVASV